ncbi:MAG: IgGFc-binding protein [Paludibacteraceae bacterium]|nr:IgGFc-binding protein [Paludibacteraceae bacterium]
MLLLSQWLVAATSLVSRDPNWLGGNQAFSTTEGTDFWLTFMNNNMFDPDNENNQDLIFEMKVAISAREAMTVIVSYDGAQVSVPLNAGETKIHEIPRSKASSVYLYQSETRGYKGVHVYSAPGYQNRLFSCFLYCRTGEAGGSSRDASLVIPTQHLGKEYVIQTSPEDFYSSEFAIVATEPGTVVNIKPTFETYNGSPADTWMTPVSLNAGEAYLVATKQHVGTEDFNEDLSGTIICSNKPIAVFNGNQQTSNPVEESSTQDFSVEQALPINQWGTDFYLSLMDKTLANDFIITAADPTSTSVTMISYSTSGGVTSEVISSFPDHNSTTPIRIDPDMSQVVLHSNAPIMCYVYTTSAVDNTQTIGTGSQRMTVRLGDPANAMLPPWSHHVKSMNFFSHELDPQVLSGKTPPQLFYAYIVVPAADIVSTTGGQSKISMDGAVIPTSEFHLFEPDNTMAYAFHPFDHAVSSYHHIESTGEGFVGMVYALSHAQGYFHTLGYNPDPKKDSLFINNTELLMSPKSYDMDSLDGHGWYQRQWGEWIRGRLDTAVVCDSSFVHWTVETPIERPVNSIDWSLYDVTGGIREKIYEAPFPKQESPNPSDILHPLSYQFILPEETMENRQQFYDYELEIILHRNQVLCGGEELDTLRSVTRVTRLFNDTVWRAICIGDSLPFFNDSLYNQADLTRYEAGEKKETMFKATHSTDPNQRWKYNVDLGRHTFTRSYVSQFGCDSIVTLELFVCDTFRFVDTIHLCSNQDTLYHNYLFRGKDYTGDRQLPGVSIRTVTRDTTVQTVKFRTDSCDCQKPGWKIKYKDRNGRTFMGCDSIYELHLFIHKSYDIHVTDTMNYAKCPDSVYHWTIERNGVRRDSLITKHSPGMEWDEAAQAWIGYFGDTLRTKTCNECNNGHPTGCDSINSLTLIIPPVYHFEEDTTWCRIHYDWNKHDTTFQDFRWKGHHGDIVYSEGGDYYDNQKSRYGADSIYHLHLVYSSSAKPIYNLVKDTVCRDTADGFNRYTWISTDQKHIIHIDTIHKDSAGYFYYVNEDRCDSIYALELLVLPTYFFPDTARITQEGTYWWAFNDSTYGGSKATQHYDSLINSSVTIITRNPGTLPIGTHSCDSIHQLVIYIGNVYRDTLQAFACGEDSYFEWWGKDQEGNDSLRMTIYGWDLPAQNEFKVYEDPHLTAMGNDSVYYLKLYRAPSHYKDTLVNVCQDTVDLYTWRDKHQTHMVYDKQKGTKISASAISLAVPGDYFYVDSLETDSFECDSVWELHLHIEPIFFADTTVKVCQFSDYQWTNNSQDSILDSKGRKISTFPTDHVGDYKFDVMFHTRHGCDSTWHLTLHVDTVYLNAVSVTDTSMCDKDSIVFVGRTIYGSNSPNKPADVLPENIVTIPNGKDSVVVPLKGFILSSLGCDSAVEYSLTVFKTYSDTTYLSLCQPSEGRDSFYVWTNHDTVWDVHNQRYIPADSIPRFVKGDTTYLYIDSLRTSFCTLCNQGRGGCDSLFYLYLTIDSTYHYDSIRHICANERVTWQGITYAGYQAPDIKPRERVRTPGVYRDTVKWPTTHSCDSVFYLKLHVHPIYHIVDTVHVCDSEREHTFEFKDSWGTNISERITFAPNPAKPEEDTAVVRYDTICRTRQHMLRSVDGCDSLVTLTLVIHPTYEFVARGKGCFGETVHWRGKDYSSTGIFYDRYQTHDGCDSVFVLEFLVKPLSIIPIYDTICESETFIHIDTIWYADGRFTTFEETIWTPGNTRPKPFVDVTFKSANGECDSIIYRYHLTVRDTFMFFAEGTLCSNDTFYSEALQHEWKSTAYEYDTNVHVLPFDTVLIDSLTTVSGCDSLYVLTAHVFPSYRHIEYDTICGNETLLWRDSLLHDLDFGLHYVRDSFTTIHGCDSIFELQLYVQPKYYFETNETVCADDPYDWRGNHYEHLSVGEHFFHDSLLSRYGCDSVFHLYLTVVDTTFEVRNETICIGDTIHVLDTVYSEAGSYKDTTLNEWGCRHFIYTHLTVIPPTVPTVWMDDHCKNEEVFDILYTYTGEDPIAFSLYFDSLAHEMGFEDIIGEPVTTYSDPMVITLRTPLREGDKMQYPKPDHYRFRLVLDNGYCQRPDVDCVCDTAFEPNYPSWLLAQRFGDVIAILNASYNGGYVWSDYQWYHGEEPMIGETHEYLYVPTGLIVGDQYHVRLTREGETEDYPTCPITIIANPVNNDFAPHMGYLSVVPTCIVTGHPFANILSRKDGMYRISGSTGHLISEGVFRANVTPIELPAVTGMYIVQLWSPDTPEEPYRSIKVIVKEVCENCNTPF